jgi:hypothetical protein
MEKSKFEKFITKYNLGGACESVLYTVGDKTLSTRAISDDKNVVCEVTGPSMGIEDGTYAVYETVKLRSMLNVLDDALRVDIKTVGSKPVGLKFSDTNTEVTFVLADSSVIPAVPDVKKLPPFDLTVQMDENFVTRFIKAKNALPEAETFTIMGDGQSNTVDVVLGHSTLNTNRVKLTVTTKETISFAPISFSARYLRDILNANKDARGGELLVSSKGLAKTSFTVDNITSTYYLVQISI